MRIVQTYSHLNGFEFLHYHKPKLWEELTSALQAVDAEDHKTKISDEQRMKGRALYAPKELNKAINAELEARGWNQSRTSYWVTEDEKLIRATLGLSPDEQKAKIAAAGAEAIYSYNQTDFVKERVAIEVQFGKYSFVAYDLFVKHMAFFVGDEIDLGIEVLPMKSMQLEMSSGPAYYEGELYNLIRQGRGIPAVPLILVGVAP